MSDTPDGLEVWLQVGRAVAQCQRLLNTRLAAVNLSLAQHEVLVAINRQPGLTQQDLAAQLVVVKSNVSNLLRKLEARGLIERQADGLDARHNQVRLSGDGQALVQRSMAIRSAVVDPMLAVLSSQEIRQIGELFTRTSAVVCELEQNSHE